MQAVHIHIDATQRHRAAGSPVLPLPFVSIAVLHASKDIKTGDFAHPFAGECVLVHGDHGKCGNDAGDHPKKHRIDDIHRHGAAAFKHDHHPDKDAVKQKHIGNVLDGRHHEQQWHRQQKCNEGDRKLFRRVHRFRNAQRIQHSCKGIHQPPQKQAVLIRKHQIHNTQARAHHKGDAIEQAVLSQNTDPSRQAGDCKQQAARHVQVHMHLSAVLFLDLRLTVPVILHFQPAITQELLDLVQRCLPSFCKIPVILFLSKKIPILFYCTTKIHRMILFFNHFPGKG